MRKGCFEIILVQDLDALGELECFTWDLFPIVDTKKTLHLEENGLPRIGTNITLGMIVIGKIGKTRYFNKDHRMNCLESLVMPFELIKETYGHMWYDGSFYANSDAVGEVVEAFFEIEQNRQKAIVMIRN